MRERAPERPLLRRERLLLERRLLPLLRERLERRDRVLLDRLVGIRCCLLS